MCHHWMGQNRPNLWVTNLFESLILGQHLQCKFTKVWKFPSQQMTCLTALLNIPHTAQIKYSSVPHLSLSFQYIFSKPTLPPADCPASAHPFSVQAVLGLQQNHRCHDLRWCFWSVLLSGSNQYNSWKWIMSDFSTRINSTVVKLVVVVIKLWTLWHMIYAYQLIKKEFPDVSSCIIVK